MTVSINRCGDGCDIDTLAKRIAAATTVKDFRNRMATEEDYHKAVAVLGEEDAAFILTGGKSVFRCRKRAKATTRQPDGRKCLRCGSPLIPKPKEAPAYYSKRKFCDRACAMAHMLANPSQKQLMRRRQMKGKA